MDETLTELTFDKDDKFERKKYAENLTNFLLNTENNQYVICVNSSWGTGKTWFVHMFINMLKSEKYAQSVMPVYYNAWENDDFENAFVPLMGEINNQLFNKVTKINKTRVKKAAGAILKDISFNAIKKLSADLVNPEDLLKTFNEKELFDEYISDFDKYKKAKFNFIEAMSSFTSKVNKKVFIFIDELDRCRPTFAIETLERIKHYFDIDNIYFILLLDKEQLSYSVKTLYGDECDTIGYLMRFIDIEYKLPKIEGKDYYKIIKYQQSNFERSLGRIIDVFDLSLRDIDKLILWIKVFRSNAQIEDLRSDLQYLFSYFILLKLKFPDIYQTLFNKTNRKHIVYENVPFAEIIDNNTFLWEKVRIVKMFFKIHGLHDFPTKEDVEELWVNSFRRYVIDLDKTLSFLENFLI